MAGSTTAAGAADLGRIVRVARARVTLAEAGAAASVGGLVGGLLAVAVTAAGLVGWLPPAGGPVLALPLAGALGSALPVLLRPATAARAALVLDRRTGSGESFVTALERPTDAFRALAAARAMTALGGRRLRDVLPIPAPRLLVAAVLATGLAAALVAVGTGGDGAESRRASQGTGRLPAAAGSVIGAGGVASADPVPAPGPAPGPGAVPSPESGSAGALLPDPSLADPAGTSGPVTPEQIRDLARDLAARGVAAGSEALKALARGDAAEAERILRQALAAPSTTASDGRNAASGTASAASDSGTGVTPGSADPASAPRAWSAGAWPLRYDRVVRAWLRVEAAVSSGAEDLGEPR